MNSNDVTTVTHIVNTVEGKPKFSVPAVFNPCILSFSLQRFDISESVQITHLVCFTDPCLEVKNILR